MLILFPDQETVLVFLPPILIIFICRLVHEIRIVKQTKCITSISLDRLIVIFNGLQLVSEDLFTIPLDYKHVIGFFLELNVHLLSSQLFRVSHGILSKHLFDSLVIQDVIVWHFQGQLTEAVPLINIANFLIIVK